MWPRFCSEIGQTRWLSSGDLYLLISMDAYGRNFYGVAFQDDVTSNFLGIALITRTIHLYIIQHYFLLRYSDHYVYGCMSAWWDLANRQVARCEIQTLGQFTFHIIGNYFQKFKSKPHVNLSPSLFFISMVLLGLLFLNSGHRKNTRI